MLQKGSQRQAQSKIHNVQKTDQLEGNHFQKYIYKKYVYILDVISAGVTQDVTHVLPSVGVKTSSLIRAEQSSAKKKKKRKIKIKIKQRDYCYRRLVLQPDICPHCGRTGQRAVSFQCRGQKHQLVQISLKQSHLGQCLTHAAIVPLQNSITRQEA